MELNNTFKQAEEQYFILRGQLETGRITREQFEAALHDLMIEDTQGRQWAPGIESGKWHLYENGAWVEADPYSTGITAKPVSPPRSEVTPSEVKQAAPVPEPKVKKGLGCFQIGCIVVLAIVFVMVAVGAAFAFHIPQQLGLFPSAERTFASTPDREAASALKDELAKAGIDTKGMDIYVLPFRDKPGSVAYVVLDSAQGFNFKSGSKDPVIDYFKQMAKSDSAKKYDLKRIAIEYKGKTGASLVNLTASTDIISAFANGAIARTEFLQKVDGQANWVGFYQEVLK